MNYISIFSRLNPRVLIQLLAHALPEKENGFGSQISILSKDKYLHEIVPSSIFSKSAFNCALRKILLDNACGTVVESRSLASLREQQAKGLNKLREEVLNYCIKSQQKEMSLSFFESLSNSGVVSTDITQQFNIKQINNALDRVSSAYHLSSDPESAYLQASLQPNNAHPQDIYTESTDNFIASILMDGSLIYILLSKAENDIEVRKLTKMLQNWLLLSTGVVSASRYGVSNVELESLDEKVSLLSVILALSAASYEIIKRSMTPETDVVPPFIKMMIKDESAYPWYKTTNIDKIINQLN